MVEVTASATSQIVEYFKDKAMKNNYIIILAICVYFFFSSAFAGEKVSGRQSDSASATAFAAEPTYKFEPFVEGKEVSHAFVIKNTGGKPLVIQNIKTSCGCTTADYPKEIPPGGEGKVVINVDTTGFGGQIISKNITVYTNDSNNENLTLRVTGPVEKFANIEPGIVRLKGVIGEDIRKSVTIVPFKKYPFKITESDAKNVGNIRFDIERRADRYLLTVVNLAKTKTRYLDIITLKTDSPVKPEINIKVFGDISEK